MLLLALRLFTKGLDQRPPRRVCLDDVLVALREACASPTQRSPPRPWTLFLPRNAARCTLYLISPSRLWRTEV
jgi:hypothetical protein